MKDIKKKFFDFFKDEYNLLFLLVLIIFCVTVLRYNSAVLGPDEAHFAWISEKISANPLNLFSEMTWRRHPPLIPAIVSFFDIFLPFEWAVILVPKLFAIAALILIYILGGQLRNKFVGLFAATLLAFNVVFVRWSIRYVLDIPLLVFFTLVFIYSLKFEKHPSLFFLFVSFTLLTKRTGIIVLPFVIVFLTNNLFKEKKLKLFLFGYLILGFSIFLIFFFNLYSHLDLYSSLDFKTIYIVLWTFLANFFPYLPARFVLVVLFIWSSYFLIKNFRQLRNNKIKSNLFFLSLCVVSILFLRLFSESLDISRYFIPALGFFYLILGLILDIFFNSSRIIKCGVVLLFIFLLFFVNDFYFSVEKLNVCVLPSESAQHDLGLFVSNLSGNIYAFSISHELRYYSKKEYLFDGGQIYGRDETTDSPSEKYLLESQLNFSPYTYLIIPVKYNEHGVNLIYKYDEENAKYISDLGFEPIKVFYFEPPYYCFDNQSNFFNLSKLLNNQSNLTKFFRFFNISGAKIKGEQFVMPAIIVFNKTEAINYTALSKPLLVEDFESLEGWNATGTDLSLSNFSTEGNTSLLLHINKSSNASVLTTTNLSSALQTTDWHYWNYLTFDVYSDNLSLSNIYLTIHAENLNGSLNWMSLSKLSIDGSSSRSWHKLIVNLSAIPVEARSSIRSMTFSIWNNLSDPKLYLDNMELKNEVDIPDVVIANFSSISGWETSSANIYQVNNTLSVYFAKDQLYPSVFLEWNTINNALLTTTWSAYNRLEFDVYSEIVPLQNIHMHIQNSGSDSRLVEGSKLSLADASLDGSELSKWHRIRINISNGTRDSINSLNIFTISSALSDKSNVLYIDNLTLKN
jgi:hypothetical protein